MRAGRPSGPRCIPGTQAPRTASCLDAAILFLFGCGDRLNTSSGWKVRAAVEGSTAFLGRPYLQPCAGHIPVRLADRFSGSFPLSPICPSPPSSISLSLLGMGHKGTDLFRSVTFASLVTRPLRRRRGECVSGAGWGLSASSEFLKDLGPGAAVAALIFAQGSRDRKSVV